MKGNSRIVRYFKDPNELYGAMEQKTVERNLETSFAQKRADELNSKAVEGESFQVTSMIEKRTAIKHPGTVCANCKKKLARHPYGDEVAYGYEGNGVFCTLRCGYRFGHSANKAGFKKH